MTLKWQLLLTQSQLFSRGLCYIPPVYFLDFHHGSVYLPHFFPAGLFPMLQRFGMVMAIPGLIPACFARGDSNTAQRHFGAVLIKEPTLEQQVGGTAALALPAALKHGLKLAAADLIGVFPHSPAALTSHMKTFEATKQANITTTQALMLLLIVSILE